MMIDFEKMSEKQKAIYSIGGLFALIWIIVICIIIFTHLPISDGFIGGTVGIGGFLSTVIPAIIGYCYIVFKKIYPDYSF